MPGDLTALTSGLGSQHVDARVYATTVTLSAGTATLTFTDIDGIEDPLDSEPYVFVSGPTGGETVSAKGSTQATIGGDTTDDVECLVVVPDE